MSIVFFSTLLIAVVRLNFPPQTLKQTLGKNAQPQIALEKLTLAEKVKLTDEEWKATLSPLQYKVLRQKGTELAFTGELLHIKEKGTYVTADCGVPVFRSDQKYNSETGWPSFWAPIDNDAIELKVDTTLGIERVEVIEKKCGSHLGHVFDDGPEPTGKRFCINSAALHFIPDTEKSL